MTIQDDAHNWEKSGKANDQARLLLVDQADYNSLHIFFDD